MDIRYSTGKEPFKRMTTEELRKEFLIQNVFIKDDVSCVYSHVDRIVTMGCMPVDETVNIQKNIDPWKNFGVTYLLERRELGTINIGGDGVAVIDGKETLTTMTLSMFPWEPGKCSLRARIPLNPQSSTF